MEILVVTAAIIKSADRFLITQRKIGAPQALKWEFPGGKLEREEEPEACLRREIKEELNVSIRVGDIYKVVCHRYEQSSILLLCYECVIDEGEPECIECEAFQWVKAGEMDDYEFAEADVPVVNKIKKEHKVDWLPNIL